MVFKLEQEKWLKTYIDINIKLKTKAKNKTNQDFYKLINVVVFGITVENVRKDRNIKCLNAYKIRNCLTSEPDQKIIK